FSYEDGEIVLNEQSSDIEITLPPTLNKYFGLPLFAQFKSNTRYPARKEIVQEEDEDEFEDEVIKPPFPKPPPGQAQRLLVFSNLVENQLFDDRCVPLLKELKLSHDYNQEVEHDFNPVTYLPLHGEEQNQITLDFFDESLSPADFGETTIGATLHFRPKPL
ncbi:unnamed protein product, partial [Allacma fusca]